jgi:hypothetical protein
MRSIETLRIEDYLGVLTFSDTYNWRFPISHLDSALTLRQALDTVSQVEAAGTTMMYQTMQEGVNAMTMLTPDVPKNRHILLLSDGQSTDGTPEQFMELVGIARSAGVKISTIALGEDADISLMEQMAEVGEGRFYFVKDAADLPNILISESLAARSENIQLGQTGLKMGELGHPLISGLSQGQLPLLNGYNSLTSKTQEGAEDILVSTSFEDPILSAWRYGLGRVVAWATDIGEEWLENWPAESEGQFWSQVVRYALADPSLRPAQVIVETDGDKLDVQVSIFTHRGIPLNLSEVTFTYVNGSNTALKYRMAQKNAGFYKLDAELPPQGAYRAVVSFRDENGKQIEIPTPFAVNPAIEWLPVDPKIGRANLERWAAISGGKMTNFEDIANPTAAQLEDAQNTGREWWWYLILALILLWPLEIAIRRRWLPWK